MKEKKYKHMMLVDRVEIQECLDKGMIFKDNAKRIEKDQTTVSQETKGEQQKYYEIVLSKLYDC